MAPKGKIGEGEREVFVHPEIPPHPYLGIESQAVQESLRLITLFKVEVISPSSPLSSHFNF